MKGRNMLKSTIGACLLVLLCGVSELRGDEPEFPKTIAVLDVTNAEYFVSMTLLRQRAIEDAGVLSRLATEKQIVSSNLNAKLVKDYRLLMSQQYVWDAEDLTIYQLLEEKTWRGEPKRLKHLKFKTLEEAKPVLELLQDRAKYEIQQKVIEGLVSERGQLAREADAALRQKFNLDEKGNYSFDVKTRSIIQTGVKAQPGAKREAKE